MVAIGSTNKAFFFDGVSDSVIIPQGSFSDLGHKKPEGGYDARTVLGQSPQGDKENSITFGNFHSTVTIEAWVMPDCGGTIIKKEGQFELSLGNVDTPGPAIFTVFLSKKNVEKSNQSPGPFPTNELPHRQMVSPARSSQTWPSYDHFCTHIKTHVRKFKNLFKKLLGN